MSDDYRIALREDDNGDLDDVVARGVDMFRAEMMDDQTLWMSCLFGDGDHRLTFWVRGVQRFGGGVSLDFQVTETPEGDEFPYEDPQR